MAAAVATAVVSPPRGVTSPRCCIAWVPCRLQAWHAAPGGEGKPLCFVFFIICSLHEATAKGCAGNTASHPSMRSSPETKTSFFFFLNYCTGLLGRNPPHLLTKHLLNLPAVPPCPFPYINLPDYHCRPRTEREPSPSSGHLLHHVCVKPTRSPLSLADSLALGDAHEALGCSPLDQGSLGCSPGRRSPEATNMLIARDIGRVLSANP